MKKIKHLNGSCEGESTLRNKMAKTSHSVTEKLLDKYLWKNNLIETEVLKERIGQNTKITIKVS